MEMLVKRYPDLFFSLLFLKQNTLLSIGVRDWENKASVGNITFQILTNLYRILNSEHNNENLV